MVCLVQEFLVSSPPPCPDGKTTETSYAKKEEKKQEMVDSGWIPLEGSFVHEVVCIGRL